MSEIIYPEHIITEWKLNTKYKDVKIYIYKITNVSFKQMNNVKKELLNIINDNIICSFGYSIGALNPFNCNEIKSFFNIEIATIENTEKYNFIKKVITEMLIIESLIKSQYENKKWKIIKDNKFMSLNFETLKLKGFNNTYENIEIYKKLKISCNINEENGDINISFFPTSLIVSSESLIDIKNIKEGTKLIDITNGSQVIFIKRSNKKNEDIISNEINYSVYDYLKNKHGNEIITRYNIKKESNTIIAYYINQFKSRSKIFKNIEYSFAPEILRLDKNECQLKYGFNKQYSIIDGIKDIHNILNMSKKYINIDFDVNGIDILKHGFDFCQLKQPEFIVGKNEIENKRNKISDIINNRGIADIKYKIIKGYIIVLLSEKLISSKIDLFNKKLIKYTKKIGLNFNMEILYTTNINEQFLYKNQINYSKSVLIILDNNSKLYEDIKKLLSKKAIPNQIISKNTLMRLTYNELGVEEYKDNGILLNIILGLYFKSGKNGWKLKNNLYADCYIGLDVSHENDKHMVACVVYLFYNNELIIREIGEEIGNIDKLGKEKIPPKTIENIFTQFFNECNKLSRYPKHIVIHRDGFCRKNENETISNIIKSVNKSINLTIVSIIKKPSRKIEMKIGSKDKNEYKSFIGSYIKKSENISYLISTESIGTKKARPFKIDFIYSTDENINIEHITNDIYYLSYMCFHTTLKTKLPATIYYADKSSTAHNRNFITSGKMYQKVFQP